LPQNYLSFGLPKAKAQGLRPLGPQQFFKQIPTPAASSCQGDTLLAFKKRRAIMVGTLVIFVYGLFQLFGPNPAIIISEDTTVITSPLRADGLPDYQKYWRDFGREGVTPENNGAVLFWRAVWPGELGQQHRQLVCDTLGITPMPVEHESLQEPYGSVTRHQVAFWLTEQYQKGLSPAESDELLNDENQKTIQSINAEEAIGDALSRPWTSEQLPPLADWVNSSEKPFALLTEASQRPKWWSPSPSLLGDNYEGAIQMLLPGVQRLRSVGRAYSIRAMWHAGEGRPQEAWEDIKTSMRFARLCSQGLTLVEQLVGIAIDAIALRQTTTFLHHCKPDAELARQVLADLNAFEKPFDVVRSFGKGERLFFADTVIMLLQNKKYLTSIDFGTLGGSDLNFGFTAMSWRVDWNHVLREGNRWFDRLETAARTSSFQDRQIALIEYNGDLNEQVHSVKNPARVATTFLNTRARSAWVADSLLGLLMPALEAALAAEERATVFLDLTRVAAALAVYRAEHDNYPEKLEDLVPSVLEKLPEDLYSGNPFKYSRKPDGGYVLYSVYQNGTDDRGTNYDGQIIDGEWVDEEAYNGNYEPGDLVIRVPAPAFQLPPSPILNQ
jgi:hypothetical protein